LDRIFPDNNNYGQILQPTYRMSIGFPRGTYPKTRDAALCYFEHLLSSTWAEYSVLNLHLQDPAPADRPAIGGRSGVWLLWTYLKRFCCVCWPKSTGSWGLNEAGKTGVSIG
jgi:hypothetical protein